MGASVFNQLWKGFLVVAQSFYLFHRLIPSQKRYSIQWNVPISRGLFFEFQFLRAGFAQGHVLTEEEVVNVMAEVFLHPNYTIPLIGCFRPIARKIVDKAVALLRMVPNLRSKENDTLAEVEEDEVLNEVASVIELYNRAGRGLDLHEFVCLAACRALDFAPFLLG